MFEGSNLTVLPEHLVYREPQIKNLYANVQPRYLNARSDPLPQKFEPPKIPQNPKFQNVQPRLLNPRAESPRPQAFERPKSEKEYFERVAKIAGFGSARHRYLDHFDNPTPEPDSPRAKVRAQKEATQLELGWRDPPRTSHRAFDEYRDKNKRLMQMMARPSTVRGMSPVSEYVRSGTPVKHYTMTDHYISPKREYGQRYPIWKGGCGAGGGTWRRRENSPIRPQTVREENFLKSFNEKVHSFRVPRGNVPRVALLADTPTVEYIVEGYEPEEMPYLGNEDFVAGDTATLRFMTPELPSGDQMGRH
jgi:hypothetical protein